ncbi:hypothetical protein J6590_028056 [Homalodisca vitripennis]|nr:hypothetical protein J6590_028056 [Homalodisca vitripennis]
MTYVIDLMWDIKYKAIVPEYLVTLKATLMSSILSEAGPTPSSARDHSYSSYIRFNSSQLQRETHDMLAKWPLFLPSAENVRT